MSKLRLNYSALAFLLALGIRAAPEVIVWPYPLGFDTVSRYLPALVTGIPPPQFSWSLFTPKTNILLLMESVLYDAVRDPFIVLKIVGPVLYAVLALEIYVYTRRVLEESGAVSLLASVLFSTSLLSLRIAWDLHRNLLGLIFAVATFILLSEKKASLRLMAIPLVIFTILSHELPTIFLLSVLMFKVFVQAARYDFERGKTETGRTRSLAKDLMDLMRSLSRLQQGSLSALILLMGGSFVLAVSYLDYPLGGYSFPLGAVSRAVAAEELLTGASFLLFLSFPMLIFSLPSLNTRSIDLAGWTLLVVIFTFGLPAAGLVSVEPPRVITMLAFTFPIYAALTVRRMRSHWGNLVTGLSLGALLYVTLAITVPYLVTHPDEPSSYMYHATRIAPIITYVPIAYLQSTIPAEQTGEAMHLLRDAKQMLTEDAILVSPTQFYGFGVVSLGDKVRVEDFGEVVQWSGSDLTPLVNYAKRLASQSGKVYTIWWVEGYSWYGVKKIPESLKPVLVNGHFALYEIQLS